MRSSTQRDAAVMADNDDVDSEIEVTKSDFTNASISNSIIDGKSTKPSPTKRRSDVSENLDDLILEHIKQNKDDRDEMYLKSLVPDIKALDYKIKCSLILCFQRLIFAARFGDLQKVQSVF